MIFTEGHSGHLITYGNRTFLLWKDLTDNYYMVKRLDGDIDYPSVKWSIKCDNPTCFRIYVDLKLDQNEHKAQKNEEVVLRILLQDMRNNQLVILDVSDFGSLVGDVRTVSLEKYNVTGDFWLIGNSLYFVSENEFFITEITKDNKIKVMSSQKTPYNLKSYIMTPSKSIFYVVNAADEVEELKYSPSPNFYMNIRLLKIAFSIEFTLSSFSRYVLYIKSKTPGPSNRDNDTPSLIREYYYIDQIDETEVSKIIKKIDINFQDQKIYHIFEDEETISMFSNLKKIFYFFLKSTHQVFQIPVNIKQNYQLQGLIVDSTTKNSILNTRMLLSYSDKKNPTEIYIEKFDFLNSKIDCLFLNANKRTPDCVYTISTYKNRFDFKMDFTEFGKEEKEIIQKLIFLVALTIVIIVICRRICKRKKKRKAEKLVDNSYRMSIGDYGVEEEFNIDYIKETYDRDTDDKCREADILE